MSLITKKNIVATLALSPLLSLQSIAGGYQLQTRSISGLGRALSGEAAIVEDASVMASNPAGLLWLKPGWHVSTGAMYVDTSVDVNGAFNGTATSGNAGKNALVPYLYAAHVKGDFAYGLSIHAPFAQNTDYPGTFLGTSLADESDVAIFNIRPTLSWRINEKFAIGASIDFTSAEGTLSSTLPGAGNLITLNGDDLAVGASIGFMWQATERTRVGFQYRSKVNLTLDGTSTSALQPAFNSDVLMDITLPENMELSVYHELNDKWAIHGDALWTRWSRFQTLAPRLSNGAPVPAEFQGWSNAWRLAAGATYKHNDTWTFRGGVAWDQTPINDQHRGLRNPGNDTKWISLGATYHSPKNWSLDMGYSYILADDATINLTGATGVFAGKAESAIHALGFQWNTHF